MSKIFEFGMDTLRVTQGPNGSYSHSGRLAYDFGGTYTAGTGQKEAWTCRGCPVKVVGRQAAGDHFVYFQTTERVYLPGTGVEDYLTLAMCHMDDTSAYPLGRVINPDSVMYREGTFSGGRSGAVDIHLHVQVGRGAYVGPLNSSKPYALPNEMRLEDAVYVPDNVAIKAGGALNWRRTSDAPAEGIQVAPPSSTALTAFRIGPMSEGDADTIIRTLDGLLLSHSLSKSGDAYEVGTQLMSEGDADTIRKLVDKLGNIQFSEGYGGTIYVTNISGGDKAKVEAKANELGNIPHPTVPDKYWAIGPMSPGDMRTVKGVIDGLGNISYWVGY